MNFTPRSYYQIPAGLLLAILCLLLAFGCIERKTEKIKSRISPVSTELAALYKEYLVGRNDTTIIPQARARAELQRRHAIYRFLSQGLLVETIDLQRAAILLLDRPDTSCSDDLLLAHYLALESQRKGNAASRVVAAVALDRYLLTRGLPQKYGTQGVMDRRGVRSLRPVDPGTSDSERFEMGLPRLDSLKLVGVIFPPPEPTP